MSVWVAMMPWWIPDLLRQTIHDTVGVLDPSAQLLLHETRRRFPEPPPRHTAPRDERGIGIGLEPQPAPSAPLHRDGPSNRKTKTTGTSGAAPALAPVEVSVRHSRPVRAALEAAYAPVLFAELRALLLRQFAAAGEQRIDRLLRDLLDEGLLISGLWAPMTCLDALGHACAVLQAVDALTIAEIEGTVRELV